MEVQELIENTWLEFDDVTRDCVLLDLVTFNKMGYRHH